MGYHLLKVEIEAIANAEVIKRSVLCESKEDYVKFLAHLKETHRGTRFGTHHSEILEHVNGNLHDEVHKAKLKGIYGVWVDESKFIHSHPEYL